VQAALAAVVDQAKAFVQYLHALGGRVPDYGDCECHWFCCAVLGRLLSRWVQSIHVRNPDSCWVDSDWVHSDC
jgi:hypothetical protein